MDTILEYYASLQSNPFVAPVILAWVLGVVSFLLKDLPGKLWNAFSTRFITYYSVDNFSGRLSRVVFRSFAAFAHENKLFPNINRSFRTPTDGSVGSWGFDSVDDYDIKHLRSRYTTLVGSKHRYHFFRFKNHLGWYQISDLPSDGVSYQKEVITIHLLFGSEQLILDLQQMCTEQYISQFSEKPTPHMYQESGSEWKRTKLTPRPKESVIANITQYGNNSFNSLIKELNEFVSNEAKYREKGFPFKKTILLYGPPGTGKTSMIKSIASELNANIVLPTTLLTFSKSLNFASTLEGLTIVPLEDVDSLDASLRDPDGDRVSEVLYSRSDFLNDLDGISTLDNIIVIMTTNYADQLDDALLRPGRVNLKLEVGYWSKIEVIEYIKYVFGDVDTSWIDNYCFDVDFPNGIQPALVFNCAERAVFNYSTFKQLWDNEVVPCDGVSKLNFSTPMISRFATKIEDQTFCDEPV